MSDVTREEMEEVLNIWVDCHRTKYGWNKGEEQVLQSILALIRATGGLIFDTEIKKYICPTCYHPIGTEDS